MRLFTAVDLNTEIKDYLYSLQFKTTSAKINWIAKKNLHLTLKFFGEINDEELIKVRDNLKNVNYKKFKLKLTHIGFFPNEDNIQVIWLGIDKEDKIIDLQKNPMFRTLLTFLQKFSLRAVFPIKAKHINP